jgi:hypothetical protein
VVNGEDGCKDIRIVAILADIAGQYVVRALTDGVRAVMATETVPHYVDVIKIGW